LPPCLPARLAAVTRSRRERKYSRTYSWIISSIVFVLFRGGKKDASSCFSSFFSFLSHPLPLEINNEGNDLRGRHVAQEEVVVGWGGAPNLNLSAKRLGSCGHVWSWSNTALQASSSLLSSFTASSPSHALLKANFTWFQICSSKLLQGHHKTLTSSRRAVHVTRLQRVLQIK